MKRTSKVLGFAVTSAAVLALTAWSQDTNTNNTAGAATTPTYSTSGSASASSFGPILQGDQLLGKPVTSSDGKQLGNLENLVVDLTSGHVLYGVIGTSQGKRAVPPGIFQQASGNNLTVQATQQQINSAPDFGPNANQAAQWGQASFVSQVYQHFGQNAWWQGSTPADQGSFNNVHKANELVGTQVIDVNNQPVGQVKNVAYDLPAGRIAYVVMAPNASLGLGNNLYPLPPMAFTPGPNQQTLVSNLSKDQLNAAPHLQAGNFSDLSNSSFATQVYQYYGKDAGWIQTANSATAVGSADTSTSTGTASSSSSAANPSPGTAAPSGTLGTVMREQQLLGNQVVSSDGQNVGKLDNLIFDLQSGHILYGVVGMGNNKVALPPGIFTQPTGQQLRVQATKQQIESAPKFTQNMNNPQSWGQAGFVSQVYQHFGQNAWWQGSTPADQGAFKVVHKANQIHGTKVLDVSNRPIGQVNSVAMDLTSGRIAYLILAPDPNLGLGNNLYAIPPSAFTAGPNPTTLVSDLSKDKLAAAPHFAANNWSSLSNPSFAAQVYQYYGKQPWFQGGGNLQPTGR